MTRSDDGLLNEITVKKTSGESKRILTERGGFVGDVLLVEQSHGIAVVRELSTRAIEPSLCTRSAFGACLARRTDYVFGLIGTHCQEMPTVALIA